MEENYSIGKIRLQFLHEAENMFTTGDFNGCIAKIGSFLHTIHTPEIKEKIKEKDVELDAKAKESNDKLIERAKREGFLERSKMVGMEQDRIELSLLDEKLDFCWDIALEKGLFHE